MPITLQWPSIQTLKSSFLLEHLVPSMVVPNQKILEPDLHTSEQGSATEFVKCAEVKNAYWHNFPCQRPIITLNRSFAFEFNSMDVHFLTWRNNIFWVFSFCWALHLTERDWIFWAFLYEVKWWSYSTISTCVHFEWKNATFKIWSIQYLCVTCLVITTETPFTIFTAILRTI